MEGKQQASFQLSLRWVLWGLLITAAVPVIMGFLPRRVLLGVVAAILASWALLFLIRLRDK